MIIGYAWVSTADQDLSLQLEAPTYAWQGDSPVVWKMDRLDHSKKSPVNPATKIETCHVDLRSLTDGIDTKTAAGQAGSSTQTA